MFRKVLGWIGVIPAAGGVLIWPIGYLFDLHFLDSLDVFNGRGGARPHMFALFFGAVSYVCFTRVFAPRPILSVHRMQLVLRIGALICFALAANLVLVPLPESWGSIAIPRFRFTVVMYVLAYVLLGGGIAPSREDTPHTHETDT